MNARAVIERTGRRALKPRIHEPVWKWAERHVRLSVRTTNTPGPYDSSWIPYTRGWQEAFADPRVKEISICSAAQTGKTEAILNCIRYAIVEDPGPMLWIMPAESLARSFSETRLQPSLRDCPPCAAQIPDDPDQFKLLEMHFADCTVNLVGANSPAQLSSRPIRFLFADEVDKFPEAHSREAGALELAKVRTTSFWNSKIIVSSTPTVESGQIWQAYLAGSRHKYFVSCPACAFEQELLFPQLKWPRDERTHPGAEWNVDEVERLAYYECASCRIHIEQNARHAMIRGGRWKATNPNAPADRLSFHLSALVSPWRTWGSIAREFLEVKDSPSGLQNFTNAVLAEPWKAIQGEAVSETQLLDMRADYPLGTCPVKPLFVTMAADVQRESVYFTVRAWAEGQESWLVDYGQLPALDDLNAVMAREYNVAGSDERVKPSKGMLDSGYNTQAVYEFCSLSRGKLHPSKGWDHLAQPVKEAVITYLAGRGGERSIRLFHFDDGAFKTQLYLERIQDRKGPKWHLPHNIGADYVQQLTAERLVTKKNHRGVPTQVWHQVHRDNHWGDCEKLQLVQGYLLGKDLKKPLQPAAPATDTKEEIEPHAAGLVVPKRFMPRMRLRRSNWVNSWK